MNPLFFLRLGVPNSPPCLEMFTRVPLFWSPASFEPGRTWFWRQTSNPVFFYANSWIFAHTSWWCGCQPGNIWQHWQIPGFWSGHRFWSVFNQSSCHTQSHRGSTTRKVPSGNAAPTGDVFGYRLCSFAGNLVDIGPIHVSSCILSRCWYICWYHFVVARWWKMYVGS